MAIHCIHCGTELPDIARFCLICGKPPRGSSEVSTQQPIRWEYCEIGFQVGRHWYSGGIFVMHISGPYGLKTVQCSKEIAGHKQQWGIASPVVFAPSSEAEGQALLNQVVQNIIADGWEMLPDKGANWWSCKFRRQAR